MSIVPDPKQQPHKCPSCGFVVASIGPRHCPVCGADVRAMPKEPPLMHALDEIASAIRGPKPR
jgi:hypothetical protein